MAIPVSGVSIGIVFHNEQERISKCLAALLKAYRTYQHTAQALPVEFIFVDNRSTDESCRVVEEFCIENALPYQLSISETNNMARSRNKVLSLCRYQYLVFLDADCCPADNWLCKYLEVVRDLKTERWAAIGGENFPPLAEHKTLYHCQNLLKKNPLLFLNSTQLLETEKNKEVLHVPTCNVLYKAEVLKELGGFHDSFVRVGEDLQLSARLIQSEWKIIFAEGLGVEHFDRTDFKGWFLKCLRYGSVQPEILFSYPKATSRMRWIPFLVIILLSALTVTSPWIATFGILAMAIFVPVLISVLNGTLKNLAPWIVFLNGTIIFYCLGYVLGFCKTVWPISKLQSAKTVSEVE